MTNEAYLKFASVLDDAEVAVTTIVDGGNSDAFLQSISVVCNFAIDENIQSLYTGVSLQSKLSFMSGDHSSTTSQALVEKVEFGTPVTQGGTELNTKLFELDFATVQGSPGIEPYQIYTLSSLDIYFTEA